MQVPPPPTSPPLAVYAFDASAPQNYQKALADLWLGLQRWKLPAALARLDIRNRYRGSVLGPFWLTLSTVVMLAALGILYSTLFRLELRTYLPHLAVSLIVWNTIAQVVNDGCGSLISAEGIIRQMPLPYAIHPLRSTFRNAITAAHSLPLMLIVMLIFGAIPGPEAVLAILGLALIAINSLAISLFLGMVCARFRDITPIVASVMQLAFFVTPVIWKAELLGHWTVLLVLNPFYVLMETVRGPLLEGGASWVIWLAALVYTAMACGISFAFFVRFRGRIAFWV